MADPTPVTPPEEDGRTLVRQLTAWLSEQIRTKYGDLLFKALSSFIIAWLVAHQAKTSDTANDNAAQIEAVIQAHNSFVPAIEQHGKQIEKIEKQKTPVKPWE